MPLTVVFRTSTGDDSVPQLTFDGARIVIGRGAGCDVRLPDPSVSARHASIRAKDGAYVLVDEKSANGTFVGSARLAANTPRPLEHRDVFRVGRVWLEVRMDEKPATQDLKIATRELATALVSQALRSIGEDVSARLRVIDGADAGAALALADEGRVYVIGRDGACDLPLADEGVAAEHVHVVRRGELVLARDLVSRSGVCGVQIGDEPLAADRDVAWRMGDVLRLGATAIELEDPVVVALAEIEGAADEPMDPADVPPEPGPLGKSARNAPAAVEAPAPPVASPPRRAPAKSYRLDGTDVLVVVAALAILGLSALGLFLLLHG